MTIAIVGLSLLMVSVFLIKEFCKKAASSNHKENLEKNNDQFAE